MHFRSLLIVGHVSKVLPNKGGAIRERHAIEYYWKVQDSIWEGIFQRYATDMRSR